MVPITAGFRAPGVGLDAQEGEAAAGEVEPVDEEEDLTAVVAGDGWVMWAHGCRIICGGERDASRRRSRLWWSGRGAVVWRSSRRSRRSRRRGVCGWRFRSRRGRRRGGRGGRRWRRRWVRGRLGRAGGRRGHRRRGRRCGGGRGGGRSRGGRGGSAGWGVWG